MSDTPKKEASKLITHPNIWAALAAFQSEMPKIEKNKDFGKPGETMHFKYAALDAILDAILPITSKNGLTVTWEGEGDLMHCAIYHTTYEKKMQGSKKTIRNFDGQQEIEEESLFEETGVKRSLPIGVTRKGTMQNIGKDSTYARRYTLCEVLGIAAEEDRDAGEIKEQTTKNAQSFAFTKAKAGIEGATTMEQLEKAMKMVEDDVKKIEANKAPALGLTMDQYNELRSLAEKRIEAFESQA